jgi:hypothetical protein
MNNAYQSSDVPNTTTQGPNRGNPKTTSRLVIWLAKNENHSCILFNVS